jgi:hypothetical protein
VHKTEHQVFEDLLTDALAEPMTPRQRSALDTRVLPFVTMPRRSRRFLRRPAVRRSLLLVAVVLIALPLAALGGMFSTEDPFGLATPTEFQAELDVAMAEVPLPAGRTWPDVPALHADQPGVGGYSREGGRGTVEGIAVCIWLDEWLDARLDGDAAREHVAAIHIHGIRTWPSWDSVFWDQSVRDHYGPIIDAVADGNAEPVQAEMTTGGCSWLEDVD